LTFKPTPIEVLGEKSFREEIYIDWSEEKRINKSPEL